MIYGNYQSYPYQPYQPQQLQFNNIIPQLKGRMVTSIDEVKAAQVDFDGSLFVFPDLASQKIYTKKINLDGTSTIATYSIQEDILPQTPNYVTKEELEDALTQLKTNLKF